ncbi:hypothetical protein QN219_00800 [Sinorhizobium sp. 7-81]|uniref:hypothetical protein n=1 Tax=Sinorhizobium sp. 8-89 TaxID=3049089 RepID=UPI0024C2BD3D|nr:hypothetical protein [Sinorhizobium sp. 8-89]MDK1488605.1 hypothetical protein [Sinorhizobium sp. 8-89]
MTAAYETGTFFGRVWCANIGRPNLVTLGEGQLVDITSKAVPTMRDLLDLDDPVAHLRSAQGWVI